MSKELLQAINAVRSPSLTKARNPILYNTEYFLRHINEERITCTSLFSPFNRREIAHVYNELVTEKLSLRWVFVSKTREIDKPPQVKSLDTRKRTHWREQPTYQRELAKYSD